MVSQANAATEPILYETLKPVLTQNITLETFIDRENHTGGSIISSQKVGPSIADDIKVSAIWSVVLVIDRVTDSCQDGTDKGLVDFQRERHPAPTDRVGTQDDDGITSQCGY